MNTRERILRKANRSLRAAGYNASSYYEIARFLNIKTASIHYHFPLKRDLGGAVIDAEIANLEKFRLKFGLKNPFRQLSTFTALYGKWVAQNKICLLGAVAADFNTLEKSMQQKGRSLATVTLAWLVEILEAGYHQNMFHIQGTTKVKALLILSNLMGAVQLARLTGKREFHMVRRAILQDLMQKK